MLLVFFIGLLFLCIIISLKFKISIAIKNGKLDMFFYLYILNNALICKIDLMKYIRRKKYVQIKDNKKKITLKKIIKIIKKSDLRLEKMYLNIDICTTDAILTSYTVAILANFIAYILKESNITINYKSCKYFINPIYENRKIFKLELNCIVSCTKVFKVYRSFIETAKSERNKKIYN